MTDFQFRAVHPGKQKATRLIHFCFYLAALLLAIAGAYALYRYFNAWSTIDDNSHLWDLVLGIAYLVVSFLVVYATYHHGEGHTHENTHDRYAEAKNGILTYELDQVNGTQTVVLDQITKVEKPSIRELVIHLKDRTEMVLPIYLIDDEDKQNELEALLIAAAGGKGYT